MRGWLGYANEIETRAQRLVLRGAKMQISDNYLQRAESYSLLQAPAQVLVSSLSHPKPKYIPISLVLVRIVVADRSLRLDRRERDLNLSSGPKPQPRRLAK